MENETCGRRMVEKQVAGVSSLENQRKLAGMPVDNLLEVSPLTKVLQVRTFRRNPVWRQNRNRWNRIGWIARSAPEAPRLSDAARR